MPETIYLSIHDITKVMVKGLDQYEKHAFSTPGQRATFTFTVCDVEFECRIERKASEDGTTTEA